MNNFIVTCDDCGKIDVFKNKEEAKRFDWTNYKISLWKDEDFWLCPLCILNWICYSEMNEMENN